MNNTILKTIQVEYAEITCGGCGIIFYVPETVRSQWKQTGTIWHCPNGHSRVYRDSDLKIAKEQLEQERERHQETLRRLNESEAAKHAANKEVNRVQRRAKAGVCPCCNRTFKQLVRHIARKHPEQVKKEEGANG